MSFIHPDATLMDGHQKVKASMAETKENSPESCRKSPVNERVEIKIMMVKVQVIHFSLFSIKPLRG
ncbi:hypothetical protein KR067_008690 [Drosophila pandora]|nr:hypothetical protein KR067_008690 [Drosophila pandora]